MKKSIILKTLIILASVIVSIFMASGYLTIQNDKVLIEKIRDYNIQTAMDTLDKTQTTQLQANKIVMEDTAKMIAKNSSLFLLNFDKDGLEKSLFFDIKKESIKAIVVYDSVINENFLTAYKDNKKVVFSDNTPATISKFIKSKHDINQIAGDISEKIGTITLYYDESIIKNRIRLLKEDTKNKIEKFNFTIDKELEKSNSMKLFIALVSLLLILVVSSILLLNFVNKPLKKLQYGLDNFFLFLQNKTDTTEKIIINTKDEFGQMAHSLNENISVSAKLHEEIHELNTNLEDRIKEKTAKVTTLLDNAGQGFLTFDTSFRIDEEYSKECDKLLGVDIASKDISELLFKDKRKRELFKTSLLHAIEEKVLIKRNSYLSLIPSIILLNKKAVRLEYKILDEMKFMMILTNVTSQKKLEKKIQKEQEVLKMIVAIVSESDVFYDTKDEYIEFANSYESYIDKAKTPLHNITNIYRTIHTFKGSFSQLYMEDIVKFLHKIESDLSTMQKEIIESNDQLLGFLQSCDFHDSLKKSLEIVEDILGTEFLESDNYLKIDISDISNLQEKIIKVLDTYDKTTPECQEILSQIHSLSNQKLISLLSPYTSFVSQLSQRLEKEIYPFEIIGDNKFVINDSLKPFIKSLIHVFRNSIDHGIELPDVRVNRQKDEIGTLSCSFEHDDTKLHITISDDGEGIDLEKLKQKLQKIGIDISTYSKEKIYQVIFNDNFTTKDEITDISGRGVGMSAVKYELDKLNGEIKINSQKNIGTTFEFIVPLENNY